MSFISAISAQGVLGSEACRSSISRLHPMQIEVGQEEVRNKQKKIAALIDKQKKFEKYLKSKTVPVVRGPENLLYMIDHHHTSLALHREGIIEVYCDVKADLSHLSVHDFWIEAETRGWARRRDQTGKVHSPTQMQSIRHIKDLKDDPYRSLAGLVRDAGGFKKTETPLMEFAWADFFRNRIPKPGVQISWKKAIRMGLDLAKTDAAKNLPGAKP